MIIFMMLAILSSVNCNEVSKHSINYELLTHSRPDPINDTIVNESWKLLEVKIDNLIDEKVLSMKKFYEKLKTSNGLKLNISSQCDESIQLTFQEAKSSKAWAVKAINAWPSSLPPSGVFEGTFSDLGSYHQCKDVKTSDETRKINSMYCTIKFKPLLPARPRFHNIHEQVAILEDFYKKLDQTAISSFASTAQYFWYTSFRFGVCLPVITDTIRKLSLKCELNEVHQLAQKVGLDFAIQGQASSCEVFEDENSAKLDNYQIISIVIIIGCLLLTTVGTFCHHFWISDSFQFQLLTSFSVVKNTKNIFSSSESQFGCLNGIRVLSIFWIILGHLMLWSHREAFTRSFNVLTIVDPVIAIGILNGLVSVDTFFIISGFLTCYVTMNVTKGRREKFSVFWYLVTRYIRLTPGMILAVCLLFLVPLLGDGPLWKETFDPLVNTCHDNWWVNLFYIQAYVNSEKICLLPTWWLSVDMTLHVVSLFFLLALYRNKKLGIFLVVISVFVSCLLVARTNFKYGFPPNVICNMPQVEELWTELVLLWYWMPWYHSPAYFTGFLLGYLLYFKKQSLIKLNLAPNEKTIGWVVAASLLIAVQYINIFWHYGYSSWDQTFAAFWSSVSVLFWSLGTAWIVFACSTSSSETRSFSGFVNSILSWSLFQPLARVSYMVYLTHMLLIWSYSASRSTLVEMSSWTGIYIFIPHVFFSYLLGFICTILIESPFLEIQKLCLKRHNSISTSRKMNNNEDAEVMKVLTNETMTNELKG